MYVYASVFVYSNIFKSMVKSKIDGCDRSVDV